MVELVLNRDHLDVVLARALVESRHRVFIATADVKNLYLPLDTAGRGRRRKAQSAFAAFAELGRQGVEICLLHAGIPSGPFLEELKRGCPPGLVLRRCPRNHVKAVIVDGRWMYLGSANLTGAGLGAKAASRRNFEAGIWTDEAGLIDPVADMLQGIWRGAECSQCGRRPHCPEPLEEPRLRG